MDPVKNNFLDILKFRTELTYHIHRRNPRYYGHIKVIEFNKNSFKLLSNIKNICIIRDCCSVNSPIFERFKFNKN